MRDIMSSIDQDQATVTFWTSADGQAEIEVCGTVEEALAELLGQCADDGQREAILAGSFS